MKCGVIQVDLSVKKTVSTTEFQTLLYLYDA